MARTRGASSVIIPDEDGELLDREGKPINPIAHHASVAEEVVIVPPPEPVASTRTVYLIDRNTLRRDIDAWELAQIMILAMGEWTLRLSPEEFGRLPADVRRHALPVLERVE